MNSNESQNPKSLHLFITGGASIGIPHLIHTLKMFLGKNFTDHVGSAKKLKLLLSALTGVSAINMNGTTIHSALNIP